MTKNRVDPRGELPTEIEKLADKICVKINEIEAAEDILKAAKADKEVWMKELAELLDTSGYAVGSKIFLKNGREMKLKDFFAANIPSKSAIDGCKDPEKQDDMIQRKEKALKWLDDNGVGDVIKNQIIAMLPRGDANKAAQIANYLLELEVGYIREESVHPQTLVATLKEALRDGKNIPFETFSVTTGTVVEIK